MVNTEYTYAYMLVHTDYCCRVADKLIGKLGDMYQSVFFNPYIYEASEIGNVVDDARQFHTFPQVVDSLHILVKFEDLNLWRGSRPGLSSSCRISVSVGSPTVSVT